ncbi:MAG TPA: HAD-IIB family hydrolase [Candidatus Paceibacterota bacterium]|nr:HAD-IIB family hydrolase [Candidatus Paceibacterota bacterium]
MFFGFDLTQAIEVLGYPGIFAIILAESGIFFGVSLPGGSLLFTAGLLASQGFLNIYILLAVVIVAAVLGDSIGYWFGAWVGPALWRRPDGRFYKKRYLEQTRVFFDQHGARTIFLARFIPIIRTFAPILAGVAKMEYRTFFFYNMLGAFVWGGGFVLAGYLLGEAIPGIKEYLEYAILAIIVVTTIPFLLHMRAAQQVASAGKVLPRAVIFDLDDTLAESYTPPREEILGKLAALSRSTVVAIMTGAAYDRVERDLMQRFKGTRGGNMYVFSDSAARCYTFEKDDWREVYNFSLAPEDRQRIVAAIRDAVRTTGIFDGGEDHSRIIDRETSVAFAALAPDASQEDKRAWDPDGSKRMKLIDELRARVPEFEIFIGGKSTIDVTREGITKEYGVKWLSKELSVEARDMLFVGDGFYEGGNDAVVIPTGIQTRETTGPAETLRIIDELLEQFGSKEA